jgi:hypothetical protein
MNKKGTLRRIRIPATVISVPLGLVSSLISHVRVLQIVRES